MKDIKVIGFDADDTLWICEPIFRNAEEVIAGLLTEWFDSETLKKEILKNHVSNIPLYGYGIKGYILSIIETVMDLGEDKVPPSKLQEIIKIGKGMLNEPITIINDVDSILPILKEKYRLVVATKGDLLDQQRKLNASGLTSFFDEVEIMSDKTPADYTKMFKRLNIDPAEFMMVGNSLKSDILPVLELGGYGVHIPYHITWAYETVENIDTKHPGFTEIENMNQLLDLLPATRMQNAI